jgi:hypothetical protein
MERGVDNALPGFTTMMDAIVEAGGIATSPYRRLLVPINVKTPNISSAEQPADPARYIPSISKQLNVGVTTISFVEVDTAEELRQGISAMRFVSKGGTRPDDIGPAPKYWGLSEAEYAAKPTCGAQSRGRARGVGDHRDASGLENVRGSRSEGTGRPRARRRHARRGVLDDQRRRPACATMRRGRQHSKVLAACKEFNVPCGYPVSEADIETRMQQGFTVAILQSFNDAAFRAVAKGGKLAAGTSLIRRGGGRHARSRLATSVRFHAAFISPEPPTMPAPGPRRAPLSDLQASA